MDTVILHSMQRWGPDGEQECSLILYSQLFVECWHQNLLGWGLRELHGYVPMQFPSWGYDSKDTRCMTASSWLFHGWYSCVSVFGHCNLLGCLDMWIQKLSWGSHLLALFPSWQTCYNGHKHLMTIFLCFLCQEIRMNRLDNTLCNATHKWSCHRTNPRPWCQSDPLASPYLCLVTAGQWRMVVSPGLAVVYGASPWLHGEISGHLSPWAVYMQK